MEKAGSGHSLLRITILTLGGCYQEAHRAVLSSVSSISIAPSGLLCNLGRPETFCFTSMPRFFAETMAAVSVQAAYAITRD